MIIFLVILIAIVILYFLSVYNQFVTLKTRIKASIQEIGNQLKRQSDLIPNLVSSVKGYLKHEKQIFEEITQARKQVNEALGKDNSGKIIEASDRLQKALTPIRAVFESTPQLQAAGPTQKLMDELRDTADKVMYSRRTLIDLTADYNVRLSVFPSNIVGKLFNFSAEPGLTMASTEEISVSKEEMKTPQVEL